LAASGMVTQDLAALEEARERLEVALAGDESWRALHKSEGQDGAPESAARRARNTRLKMALAENPLYQAWKHLGEAIAALRETRARSEAAAAGLGDDVAALIRDGDTDSISQGKFGSLARRLEVSRTGKVAHPPRRRAESAAPQAGRSATPAQPPARTKNLPDPGHIADTGADTGAPPQRWAGTEPDEATVTFVRHEPLLPSVEKPKDLSTAHATGLFARLRTIADEPQAAPQTPNDAFAAPGGAEEAEVIIRTSESAEAQREAEARPGTVGRLRKTRPGG
jgi:hypothetical protein